MIMVDTSFCKDVWILDILLLYMVNTSSLFTVMVDKTVRKTTADKKFSL